MYESMYSDYKNNKHVNLKPVSEESTTVNNTVNNTANTENLSSGFQIDCILVTVKNVSSRDVEEMLLMPMIRVLVWQKNSEQDNNDG